jgi:hypothetical protein
MPSAGGFFRFLPIAPKEASPHTMSKTEAGSGTIPFTEYDTPPEEMKFKFWLGTGFVPLLF